MLRLAPKLLILSESKKHSIPEVQKTRERLSAEMEKDPYSESTQRQLLRYLQICTLLSSTEENEKVQSVWTCAMRPSMNRNVSTSFKTEALHCWFNLAVVSTSINKTLALLDHITALMQTLYPREVPPFDFQESVLGFLGTLVRAEAQASLAEKASTTSPLKLKLLAETVHLFETAGKIGARIPRENDGEANWKKTVEAGRLRATALLHYYTYNGMEKEVKKKLEGFGTLVKYLQVSVDAVNAREKLKGGLGNDSVLIEVKEAATAALNEIQRDNNLIYHEPVPTEIPEFPRVHAVKVDVEEVVNEILQEAAKLVDISSLASPKVVELMQNLLQKLDAVKIPTEAEITKRLELVIKSGGLDGARTTLEGLQSSSVFSESLVANIRGMLTQEADEDARIRRTFRVTRTPSSQLTNAFTTELSTLTSQLSKARDKNHQVGVRIISLAEFSDFLNPLPSSYQSPTFASQAAASAASPSVAVDASPTQRVAEWLRALAADRESLREEIRKLSAISSHREALTHEPGLITKINALIPATWQRFMTAVEDLETTFTELRQGGDFFNAVCACLTRLEDDVKSFAVGRNLEVSQISTSR